MDQITKLLEQLAIKLGTTVEYLWGVLIKQAHVNAIVNLTFVGVSGLVIVIGLMFIPKIIKLDNEKRTWDEMSIRNTTWIIYGIVNTILLLILVMCLVPAITQLLNPEYWALQEILNKL